VPPGAVVINEILAHSHAAAEDWIELRNTTNLLIPIEDWYLSDSAVDLMQFRIPAGAELLPYGYIVFMEGEFHPSAEVGFALSENGETLYLNSGAGGILTGYSAEQSFDASETDVSMGRYEITSNGAVDFVPMAGQTKGYGNSGPKPGDIVISEIMYHPISGDAEYIELYNTLDVPFTLYDNLLGEPWRLEGIKDFAILYNSQPLTMAAHERIVLVKDTALFNASFTPAVGTRIIQWLGGSLDNSGETLRLSKPGDYDTGGSLNYIPVDWVDYSDGLHPKIDVPDLWPTEPDGGIDTNGDTIPDQDRALDRITDTGCGSDPANWQPAAPSPGYDTTP
jgi:hypothetical protein